LGTFTPNLLIKAAP
jgi:hypothetical protein